MRPIEENRQANSDPLQNLSLTKTISTQHLPINNESKNQSEINLLPIRLETNGVPETIDNQALKTEGLSQVSAQTSKKVFWEKEEHSSTANSIREHNQERLDLLAIFYIYLSIFVICM